jgi:hypothetical protein
MPEVILGFYTAKKHPVKVERGVWGKTRGRDPGFSPDRKADRFFGAFSF